MKKSIVIIALALLVVTGLIMSKPQVAEARGRYGSIRIGGYNSHGLGSHYIGGYVRSGPALRFYRRGW